MKRFLFLLPLAFCLMGRAQDTTKQDTSKITARMVYEDAKAGFKDAIQGVKDLTKTLEGPAKHVYEVYIYQHRVSGITFLCITVIFIVLAWSFLGYNYRRSDWSERGWNGASTLTIFGSIFFVISLILVIVFFAGNSFTEIVNPEYHAIQDIIEVVK